MNRKILLGLLIITIFIIIINSITIAIQHPFKTITNLILLCILLFLTFSYGKEKRSEKYNYDLENPNALISGEPIAGTVYASDPEDTPGLGWIL